MNYTYCNKLNRNHRNSDNKFHGYLEANMRPVCSICGQNITTGSEKGIMIKTVDLTKLKRKRAI